MITWNVIKDSNGNITAASLGPLAGSIQLPQDDAQLQAFFRLNDSTPLAPPPTN